LGGDVLALGRDAGVDDLQCGAHQARCACRV
jgi:hypothetical protein